MHDEPVELDPTSQIGLVHPLQLSSQQLGQWVTTLTDHEVIPAFSQLDLGSEVSVRLDELP